MLADEDLTSRDLPGTRCADVNTGGGVALLRGARRCTESPALGRVSLKRACYLELTPTTRGDSRFGLALQSGFGTLLRCAPRDADDLATTLRSSGFAHCSVLDLDVVRRRLGVNQQGDDEPALTLALRRYVVVVASGDASLARGIMQAARGCCEKDGGCRLDSSQGCVYSGHGL